MEVNNAVMDIISPLGVKFETSVVVIGDTYNKNLVITNYPSSVGVAWLSRIANLKDVTCAIHATPTDSGELIETISKSMVETQAKLEMGDKPILMQRYEKQLKDSQILLKRMDQEQELVLDTSIIISVKARTREELDTKCKKVHSIIKGQGIKARGLPIKQKEGMLAASPYNELDTLIKQMTNNCLPLSTLAAAYPFGINGINDKQGFVLGSDERDEIVKIDMWLRGNDRINANWTILGMPGQGKSATVKKIILNEYARGTKIIMIDPEREYKEICNSLNGQHINCSGGEGLINPFQLREVALDDEESNNETSELALHMQNLKIFFDLILNNTVDEVEKSLLYELIEKLYFSKGINYESKAKELKNEDYPIMEELYYLIEGKIEEYSKENNSVSSTNLARYEKLRAILREISIGSEKYIWNGHTSVEMKKDMIVLDTKDLNEAQDKIKITQYFNVLTWAWNIIVKNRDERILLGVDEAYLLADPQNPKPLESLRNISKRMRKYEGGLMVITHSARDFLHEKISLCGEAILDNACFKVLLGSDGKALKVLSQLYELTDAEQELISRKQRGKALLLAGSKRLEMNVKLNEFEKRIFGKAGGR